jgi:hypothetical protein
MKPHIKRYQGSMWQCGIPGGLYWWADWTPALAYRGFIRNCAPWWGRQ